MKRSKLRNAILVTLVVLCVIAWSILLLNIFVFGQGNRDDTVDSPLPTDSLPPIELPLLTDSPPQVETPSPSASPDVIIESPTLDAAQSPTPIPPPEVISIIDNDKELSEILDRTAANFNCVAASLAVYDGGNTFSVYQYGYANKSDQRLIDINTKFRVASLSKIITTICALVLAEEGTLDLDEDISLYLGYTVRNPVHPYIAITPRMLMRHTSSLIDSESFLTSRGANASSRTSTGDLLTAGSVFSRRVPGSGYQYTNFGIAVLGAVCESVSDMLLDSLVHEKIFKPLDIDAAYTPENLQDKENVAVLYNANHGVTYSVQSQLNIGSSGIIGRDHHLAQGNLTISAIDYARILAMLCNGGVFNGVEILTNESVQELHNADVEAGMYMQGLAIRYQEAAFLGENIYWHTGSAFGELTQIIYNLETRYITVVFTTGSNSGREPNGMIDVCTEMSKLVW